MSDRDEAVVPAPKSPPEARGRVRRGFGVVWLLVLLVTGVVIALTRYGLTTLTISAAVCVLALAVLTGLRARRSPQTERSTPDGPVRRAVLTGTALSAATVVGETLRRRPAAEPPAAQGLSLTDYADLAVDRQVQDDPHTWDWTPALREALAVAATRARRSRRIRGSSAYRRTGLPTVRIPQGSYRVTGRVDLEYVHGLTVAGEGRQVSVLVFESDGVLFDVHRSSNVTFSGLTVTGRDPSVDEDSDIQGLREGSCAFQFKETTSDDNEGGGNTYACTFIGVEVNEMHKAFAFAGDQMTDGIIWNDLRMRDNFIDFDYANGNTVNHQMFGGEVLYGVTYPEDSYAARLQTWTNAPDLRDGAVLNVSTGGDVSFFGGSLIVRKPTLAFAVPPQDASQGAVSNVAGYNFFATRWEFRDRDPSGDPSGLQRSTLVRWLDPTPDNRNVQPTLRFDACRFIVLIDDLDLLYLTNAAAVSWDGCRVFPPDRGRIVTLVNPATDRIPGAFLAVGSSVLPVVRRVMEATGDGVDHVVEVESRGVPDVGQGSSPAGYSTVVAGVPSTARRVLHRDADGYLLAQGQPRLVVQLRVPAGALLKQVGVVLLPPATENVNVTVSADGRQLAALTAGAADSKPLQLVEQFAQSGFLTVRSSRGGRAPLRGFVYAEYF